MNVTKIYVLSFRSWKLAAGVYPLWEVSWQEQSYSLDPSLPPAVTGTYPTYPSTYTPPYLSCYMELKVSSGSISFVGSILAGTFLLSGPISASCCNRYLPTLPYPSAYTLPTYPAIWNWRGAVGVYPLWGVSWQEQSYSQDRSLPPAVTGTYPTSSPPIYLYPTYLPCCM